MSLAAVGKRRDMKGGNNRNAKGGMCSAFPPYGPAVISYSTSYGPCWLYRGANA